MIFTLVEAVRMAFSSLLANKMRSFLTMLGVIIGVMSVVALVSIGHGATRAVTDEISGFAANVIFVGPGYRQVAPGIWQRAGELQLSHLEALQAARLPGVLQVAADMQGTASIRAGNRTTPLPVMGATAEWAQVMNWRVDRGRFISQEDVVEARPVAVMGPQAIEQLFGDPDFDPVGQVVTIGTDQFTVVGRMAPKDGMVTGGFDRLVVIPLTTARARVMGHRPLTEIIVAAATDQTQLAEGSLRNYLTQLMNDPEAFRLESQQQILNAVGQVTGILTILLAGITGISLLVGGIGIMNIMLVSVTERTREIGIRKALGAKNSYVLTQFVVESVTLSGLGGLLGIGLGALVTWAVAQVGDWPFVIEGSTVALAFSFAAAVGLFFGIWPARRAAQLDPIEALRYE